MNGDDRDREPDTVDASWVSPSGEAPWCEAQVEEDFERAQDARLGANRRRSHHGTPWRYRDDYGYEAWLDSCFEVGP